MVELYPALSGGQILRLLASHGEFTCIVPSLDNILDSRVYIWFGDVAYDVTDIFASCRGVVQFSSYTLDIGQWFETITGSLFYVVEDLDEYARFLADIVGDKVRDKSVILAYSGGKDSTAALIVLLKLQEYVPFKLHVCYTYLPYLENTETLKFLDKLQEKLGVTVEILSPPPNIVRKYLAKEGLPYRRSRWCTYLKVRPLREYMKKHNIQVRVVGDRVTECEKRWKRLIGHAIKQEFASKKEVRPTYIFTLLDVVKICREYDLVNPQYYQGLTRVSCVFCPYKTLYELRLERIDSVEDPGFIETILRRSWLKWYYDSVSYEDFIELHLWRYVPNVAKMFAEFRKFVEKRVKTETKLPKEELAKQYSSLWTEPLPKLPVVSIDKLVDHIVRFNLRPDVFEKKARLAATHSASS